MSKTIPLFIEDVTSANEGEEPIFYPGCIVYDWYIAWCNAISKKCVSYATFTKHLRLNDIEISRSISGNYIKLLAHKPFCLDISTKYSFSDPIAKHFNEEEKTQHWINLIIK